MKQEKKFSGVVVPMMTPFTSDHTVDTEAAGRLINHVVNHGAHPFVLGTTGEAVSVSLRERKLLVTTTVEVAKGRATLYAGISGNCLYDAIEEANFYADLGVDAVVSTMPSYYPVDEDQMLRYFTGLADKLRAPLIIYNIPATTHLSIPVSLVDKLSTHENIAGFKDSEKGTDRIQQATGLWKDREDFCYLIGWALMSKTALELGADGIIPSSGNLAPAVYRAIYDAVRKGDRHLAEKAQEKGDLLSEAYQKGRILSHSLAAFKAMLAAYELCEPHVLPPLYPLQNETEFKASVLEKFGDLNRINSITNAGE